MDNAFEQLDLHVADPAPINRASFTIIATIGSCIGCPMPTALNSCYRECTL